MKKSEILKSQKYHYVISPNAFNLVQIHVPSLSNILKEYFLKSHKITLFHL